MAATIRTIGEDTEVDKLLNRVFTSPMRVGYVEVGPTKTCLPVYYKDFEERIRKFEVRDDDVFLFGLPKTGTTWCHELLWMLLNDLDYEGAEFHTTLRCPMLEMGALYDYKAMNVPGLKDVDLLNFMSFTESPRSIKSHLPWDLVPEEIRTGAKQPKIVLTFRNPRDTCVSNYHQVRATAGFTGTFEEFVELYLGGRAPFGPFWKHVFSFWERRHNPNVFVMWFEDLKADLPGMIRKMAKFLNKTFTDEQFEKLAKHLSFESMKNNPSVNVNEAVTSLAREEHKLTVAESAFVRSGKVGGHTSLMTPDIIARVDAWIKENTAGTDFPVQ